MKKISQSWIFTQERSSQQDAANSQQVRRIPVEKLLRRGTEAPPCPASFRWAGSTLSLFSDLRCSE